MSTPTDAASRLRALMEALAEQAAQLSDKSILDDAAAQGIDVKAEAARVRDVLLNGVLRTKKRRRQEAKQAHANASAGFSGNFAALPSDPQSRLRLLTQTLQRKPGMREAVATLQHRDFESLTDTDVISLLRQMQALGLLDDPDPET